MREGRPGDWEWYEKELGPPSSGCCKMLDILSLPCLGSCPVSMICVSINTLYVDVEKVVLIDSPENCHVPNCLCSFSLSPLVLWGLLRLARILIIPCVWVDKGMWIEQDYFDRPECRACAAKQAGRNGNLSWGIERWGQEPFNQSISFDQSPNFCKQAKVT